MLNASWHQGSSALAHAKPRSHYRVVLAVVTAAALVAVPLLWMQRQKAELEQSASQVKQQLESEPIASLVGAIAAIGQNQMQLPQMLPQVESNLLEAVQTARERNRLELGSHVYTVRLSPDGQTLAAAGATNEVYLWNRQGTQKILSGDGEAIGAVQLSPDGSAAMANPANAEGTIQFWNLQNSTYQPPSDPAKIFTAAAFSSDGKMILNGSNGGNVRLWDRQGELVAPLIPSHQGNVTAVAFDDYTIVSGGEDGRINLWNDKGESLGYLWAGAKIQAMRVSQSGQRILVEDQNRQQVFLWNNAAGQWSQFLLGETPTVRTADLSADNALIARGMADGTVELLPLDPQNRRVQAQAFHGHQGAVNTVLFSPDRKTLISGGEDGSVRFWDVADGTLVTRFHLQAWSNGSIAAAALSSDGNRIAVASAADISIHDSNQTLLTQFANPLKQPIAKLVFSEDGRTLAIQTQQGQVSLVGLDGKLTHSLFSNQPLQQVAISPNGEHILSVSAVGLQLWNRQGPVGQPLKLTQTPQFLRFSPDGKQVVSGSNQVDAKTQQPIGQTCLWQITPSLKQQRCQAVASHTAVFSPDGKTVAIGSADGKLRLWNRQGETEHTVPSHTASITALAFDATGKTIVSGSIDGTLRLADRQGRLLGQPFVGHQSGIQSVAFRNSDSTHSKTIVSLSRDREVRMWQADWRGWLETACHRLQDHPVLQQPATDQQRQAKATCDRLVAPAPAAANSANPPVPAVQDTQATRLVVKLGERRVYVYQGQLKTSYPIAVGQSGWETPTGSFRVYQMLRHPGWTHPLNNLTLPAGTDNPLGERWMGFWTDGHNQIGFHGTPDRNSVGTAASHGCLRMYNEDAEALYEQIKLGTIVTVEP